MSHRIHIKSEPQQHTSAHHKSGGGRCAASCGVVEVGPEVICPAVAATPIAARTVGAACCCRCCLLLLLPRSLLLLLLLPVVCSLTSHDSKYPSQIHTCTGHKSPCASVMSHTSAVQYRHTCTSLLSHIHSCLPILRHFDTHLRSSEQQSHSLHTCTAHMSSSCRLTRLPLLLLAASAACRLL